MKGTFFSADFVRDNNGTPRLLELNTDTSLSQSWLSAISFTSFITILQENSIAELHLVYKDMHKGIVNKLKSEITQSGLSISITDYLEPHYNIYPTSVSDSEDRFILRMAYDESAVFDSTYTKVDFNTLKLFVDGGHSDKVVECYHSSPYGSVDTLSSELTNDPNKPDFVAKPILPATLSLQFLKLGLSGSTDQERIDGLKGSPISSNNVITKYYPTAGNVCKSIRSTAIIYGPDLSLCFLGEFEVKSIFEYPTSISGVNDSEVYTPLSIKHYFELATNPISEREGFLSDTKILKQDGTSVSISDILVSDVVDSYYISGSPGGDYDSANLWEYPGSELPSGSYNDSSIVYDLESGNAKSTVIHRIELEDGSIIESAGVTRVLSWLSSENIVKYSFIKSLVIGDEVFRNDGTKVAVSSHNILVLNQDTSLVFNTINVEESDNFVLSGSNVIVHNSPCFIAGTKVDTPNGSVNIEDVKEGDIVYSYDFETNSNVESVVASTQIKESQKVITLVIKHLDDTTSITCTYDHPFFVEGKGWSSYDPSLLKELAGMDSDVLKSGDNILHIDGNHYELVSIEEESELQTVHNLDHVLKYNNFFVYGALVHNRVVAQK